MYPTTHAVATSSEASAHLSHPNVLAQRRVPDKVKRQTSGEEAVANGAGSVYSPNAYMLLISRLENMARRGELDPRTLDQLKTHMAFHLAVLPEHSRLTIQAIEGYAQLGVENLARLPDALVTALGNPEKAQAALEFLKQPAFAAYMRNEPRNRLYSAQGVLRAS
jgi:hypothetical protein